MSDKVWLTTPIGLVGLNGVTKEFADTKFSKKGKLFIDLYLNKGSEEVKVFLSQLNKAHKDNLVEMKENGSTSDKALPVTMDIQAGKHPKFIKDPSKFVLLRFTSGVDYEPTLIGEDNQTLTDVVNRIPYGTAAKVNFSVAGHIDQFTKDANGNTGKMGGTSLYMSTISIAKMPEGSSLTERVTRQITEEDFVSSGIDIDSI